MKWLRRLLRKRREPHSLDPVHMPVVPDRRATEALERRRAALSYQPENAFHRDTQVTR